MIRLSVLSRALKVGCIIACFASLAHSDVRAKAPSPAVCQMLLDAGLTPRTNAELNATSSDPNGLYQAAFNDLCLYDLSLASLPKADRDAWLRQWQTKYDSTNSTSNSTTGSSLTDDASADVAIQAMIDSLKQASAIERFTSYQLPDQNRSEIARFQSARVGIGVAIEVEGMRSAMQLPPNAAAQHGDPFTVTAEHRLLIASSPDQGGPAALAGLQAGDRISAIDGHPTLGMQMGEVIGRIRGDEGSSLTLTIERTDASGKVTTFDVTMKRSVIIQPVVHMSELGDGVWRMKIDNFASGAVRAEVKAALANFNQVHGKALVIDVRHNPGGLFDYVMEIAEYLLPAGTVMKTITRDEADFVEKTVTLTETEKSVSASAIPGDNATSEEHLPREKLLLSASVPLVVLVDEQTASAAEILAKVLSANRRAVLVGAKTVGKGTGQRFTPLPFDRNLHITNMQFFPAGINIDGVGVEPDIAVAPSADSSEDQQLNAAHQAALNNVSWQEVQSSVCGNNPIAVDDTWFQAYQLAWQELNDNYYDPAALKTLNWSAWEHRFDSCLSTQDQYEKAMKQMFNVIGDSDQWTWFMASSELKSGPSNQGLSFLGMALHKRSGVYRIDVLDYQSPAQKVGLKEGDEVVSIDAQAIKPMTAQDVNLLLFGKPDDTRHVEVLRQGKSLSFDLKFEYRSASSAESKLLPGKVIYARLPHFEGGYVIRDFVSAIDENAQTLGYKPTRIVLDLRYNHGGGFGNAQTIASLFLAENTLVATKVTRNGKSIKKTPFRAFAAKDVTVLGQAVDARLLAMLRKTPVTVLINGSTVSAAEVVTGALVDNHRAVAVGSTTFGKGVGYNQHQVLDGAVSVTVGAYLTPSGRSVAGKGITPQIVVEQDSNAQDDLQLAAALK